MGIAKEYHGMGKAKFRGLKKVEIQLLLTATAINLKKMVRMMDPEVIKSRILNVVSDTVQSVKRIFTSWLGDIALQMP